MISNPPSCLQSFALADTDGNYSGGIRNCQALSLPAFVLIHVNLLFFQAVEIAKRERPEDDYRFKFLSYSQSGACIDMTDSSVSYAAGALTV